MNDKPRFAVYESIDGKNEFEEFLYSLPVKDSDKLLATIDKIESLGMLVAMRQGWVKRLDSDIFEIRSKVSSNIQRALYFQKVENQSIITHGFTKKTQKTPRSEIEKVRQMMEEWRRENAD